MKDFANTFSLRLWGAALLAAAQTERQRWGLWLPVVMGLGVWVYFALPVEPDRFWLLLTPFALGLVWLPRCRRARSVTIMFFLLALGFNAAQMETWRMMTPMLNYPLFVPELRGHVVAVEPASNGANVRLDELMIAALEPAQTPVQIRLKIKGAAEDWPVVGSVVVLSALLQPLSEPAMPDAYDFRRQGFFNGIGAQGFVRGAVHNVQSAPDHKGLMVWIESLRDVVAQRVLAQQSGDGAQIAIALLNGAQSGISPATLQSMRASGLFHILSISGLHLAIVAAFLFVGLRRLLAFSPYLALHWPIKKVAAALAMLILPFYTLLVGEPVPAVRSAMMTSVILLAVLTERRALSLRTVALAATLLLLVVPQTMLGASFQLSFAAVTVMITGYETLRLYRQPTLVQREPPRGWVRLWQSVWAHGGGMVLTSLLAGVATAPFTLFQFQQANWYGVFANMLGIPLTSFLIMPAGFLAYFLMPFGLEFWALKAMGWGIDGLMLLADYVGAWPGANVTVKAFPTPVFALLVLGGLWLCIWQTIWRLWGLVPIAAGVLLAMLASEPDIIIAPEFANWAVRQNEKTWIAQRAHEKDFTVKQWRQRAGNVAFLTQSEQEGNDILRCDDLACLYHSKGMTVSIVRDAAALVEDCGVDLIITPLWHQSCAQGAKVDGARLKWQGATSITLHQGWWGHEDGTVEVRSVRFRWGSRPWSPGWREDKRPPSIGQTISTPATLSITTEIKAEQEGDGE